MTECTVCFRHCKLNEGQLGLCGARICRGGEIAAENYGKLTALALDPIEKKPLAMFHPGSLVLSAGSYGCNLRCPFCQNSSISWSEDVEYERKHAKYYSPDELAETAAYYTPKGSLGLAFTYNEPLTGYEFVRDTAKLVHEKGMLNVLVSNGTADLSVLEEIAPYIDAMNIDLKGFTDHYYNDVLKGSFNMVKDFIREAVKICHVELTTLIVPDENDTEEELNALSAWIAGLSDVYDGRTGRDIPLHITRFFPRFNMTDRTATDVSLIYRLVRTAKKNLKFVFAGNV